MLSCRFINENFTTAYVCLLYFSSSFTERSRRRFISHQNELSIFNGLRILVYSSLWAIFSSTASTQ